MESIIAAPGAGTGNAVGILRILRCSSWVDVPRAQASGFEAAVDDEVARARRTGAITVVANLARWTLGVLVTDCLPPHQKVTYDITAGTAVVRVR